MAAFLPATRAEMDARGWDQPDFVYVIGDAYVDHPTFGPAIISRVLEAVGYRVAMLPQPDFRDATAFQVYGRPRLGFLVCGGNIDSMVAHYSVAKHRRKSDYYSPGGQMGLRPDRPVIVYTNRIREAYGDVPIIIGGLEASLRRFAHYDYWDDTLRRSILVDSGADLLIYGMGERAIVRIAELLDKGVPIGNIRDVRGTCYLSADKPTGDVVEGFEFEKLQADKRLVAQAFSRQFKEQDAVRGRTVTEYYGGRVLVQNPPQPPLEQEELDRVYELPYTRNWHPMYDEMGGVPAIAEVKFSIAHNRGCFGNCNFCAITFHQGSAVRARSIASVVREAETIAAMPDFKGYIHDVGGPTANFRRPACDRQLTEGTCKGRKCLFPKPCPNLVADHTEYIELLKQVERVKGVKKVFIRSGIRFDYLLADPDDSFFRKLVRDHVSGQLKVAPEHVCDAVLTEMGKPPVSVYNAFKKKYFALCREFDKNQYLVPYLISSHPGSTLKEAVALAEYLHKNDYSPEQVQDFYPTPGTASTVMYYTGIDPFTMKPVPVVTDPHEKAMQRALLQWKNPKNADLVREALRRAGREDLIGTEKKCLIRPKYPTAAKPSVGGKGGRKSTNKPRRSNFGKQYVPKKRK
ncbi:MAG: YgiQ family radical SAM protein [Clostridia bacterium]|nr:YgiQ family radical SAM protein [Clostridia bacterium]